MIFKNKRLFTALLFSFTMLLYGCGGSAPESTAEVADATVADTGGPVLSNVSLVPNPNPTVPLAAVLSLTTDVPTQVTLGFDDGSRSWSANPGTGFATSHEVPVVGMKPARMHTITATVADEAGNSVETEALSFETPALPAELPRPQVIVSNPEKMEPGVNLFNVNGRWGPDGKSSPPIFSPAVIVDSEGETLWYYLPTDHKVHDIKRLKNGNFIYEVWPGTAGMIEIDLLGNIVRRWHFTGTAIDIAEGSIPVESDALHHDMVELPNGNLLVMSSESRVYDDWYTSSTDADAPRQSANLIGDEIIEMTFDGEILNEWKLLDIIDPYRIGHGSMREDFWANHYDGVVEGTVYDWSHGNAIIYDESDHSFIMSMPYQNVVAKIDMASGELKWLLGTPENWKEPWSDKVLTPVGDVEWSYKHHAISPTSRGTYLLFDNGVDRTSPFEPGMALADSYSRAVEYAVNEETMEVSQPWEYGPDQEQFYGRYLGDVDWQPTTGNVLINVGAQETDADGNNAPPSTAQRWARWIEVTSDDAREKVWEMQIKDEGLGWSVYRVDRMPGVYPTAE